MLFGCRSTHPKTEIDRIKDELYASFNSYHPSESYGYTLKEAKLISHFMFLPEEKLSATDISWRALIYSYYTFISASTMGLTDEKPTLIHGSPFVYYTPNVFLVVSINLYHDNGKEIVRIDRKTGKVLNSLSHRWIRYGFLDEETIQILETFTMDIGIGEIVRNIGIPYKMYNNDDGTKNFEYVMENGVVNVILNNGKFARFELHEGFYYE